MIDALNIAKGFNEFFARVGPELARTFDDVDPEAFEQYLPPVTLQKPSLSAK